MPNSTDLRTELRACGKKRLAGFLVGTVTLCLLMKTLGVFRVALISALGEPAFLWLFGVGVFVVFLTPIMVTEYIQLRNPRLHCPQCGQFLARVRAMLRINKCAECLFCKAKLNVQTAGNSPSMCL